MIAVFDLDGTLALIEHRMHYILDPGRECHNRINDSNPGINCAFPDSMCRCKDFKVDYDSFNIKCVNDHPNENIILLAQMCKKMDMEIVIISGRSDIAKKETIDWLLKHNVYFDHLFMRRQGDYKNDEILKLELLNEFLGDSPMAKSRVKFIVEDRKRVVEMWRREGYTCLQCAKGEF